MKSFSDLTEQEIIALAISSEDDDARAYSGFANALMETYPASAKVFMEMSEEEHQHRRWLTDLYQKKFGDFIPLIRRSEINGFVKHKPAWMIGKLNIEAMRQRAEVIELENYRFYKQAAAHSKDPQVAKLLNQLAEAEKGHESLAARLGDKHLTADVKIEEGRNQAPPLPAAGHPAGPCGADGRLGFHAGAAVCGGLCHGKYLGNFSGGHGSLGGGRHFHGAGRRPFG